MKTSTLPNRRLGPIDTPALALGCMSMSGMYGSSDRAESIATIRVALDAGVTLLDTGDFYGAGDNELLIAEALAGLSRDSVQLSVKFGAQDPDGGFTGADARPAAMANFLAYTLRRLGTDHIDIYRPARLDPTVPIEDTIGAIAEQVQKGHVRHIGLSEVGAETIRRAHAVHPIADLQIEWSLLTRDVEGPILDTCRSASASPPTASSRGGCCPVTGAPTGSWLRTTSAPPALGSPPTTSRSTSRSSAGLARSRPSSASRPPSWPPRGCCPGATTSSPSSAPALANGSRSPWPRSTSTSTMTRWRRSRPQCRQRRRPASATPHRRCPPSPRPEARLCRCHGRRRVPHRCRQGRLVPTAA